jgi:hypothetical protein
MMRYFWVFLAIWPSGPVFAGGWDVFQTQCIAPFEVFAAPPVQRQGETAFGGGAIYESDPADGRRACRVEVGDAGLQAFSLWMAAQVVAGRYAPDEAVPGGDAWMTVDFVEPVLSVQARRTEGRAGGRVTLRIVETNRES